MKLKFCIVLGLLLFTTKSFFAQNDSISNFYVATDTLSENSGLFESDELLNISLKFDINRYKKNHSGKEYLDAVLSYKINNDSINKKIKVRSRGDFRRNYCDFPPLLLNFKMKDSITGGFGNVNKLKMVNPCFTRSEEFVLKEYLVYKLYNVITDISFRVRLLRVNYVNTARQDQPLTTFAFVIEPVDLLASRLNSMAVAPAKLNQKKIRPEIMDRVALFNYMIGNTDWSVPVMHNVQVLAQYDSDRPGLGIIVPYDFDFSGFVDTPYSYPYAGLKITTVRQRLYLGICRSEEVFIRSMNEFSEKKEEFYKVINEFPYLNEKSKKKMIAYLSEFFKDIAEPDGLSKIFLNDCIRL